MELKNYQKKVMENLSAYMEAVNNSAELHSAWKNYWRAQDIAIGMGGIPPYRNAIDGVPHICMKVPTGGGKTFMACASIKKIYDAMPLDKPRVVVWLVPSDPILVQTIKTLSDVNHPYRQRLEADFFRSSIDRYPGHSIDSSAAPLGACNRSRREPQCRV